MDNISPPSIEKEIFSAISSPVLRVIVRSLTSRNTDLVLLANKIPNTFT
jgi:hypothetical protein